MEKSSSRQLCRVSCSISVCKRLWKIACGFRHCAEADRRIGKEICQHFGIVWTLLLIIVPLCALFLHRPTLFLHHRYSYVNIRGSVNVILTLLWLRKLVPELHLNSRRICSSPVARSFIVGVQSATEAPGSRFSLHVTRSTSLFLAQSRADRIGYWREFRKWMVLTVTQVAQAPLQASRGSSWLPGCPRRLQ